MTRAATHPYVTAGKKAGSIPVRISYRIIELFSEGLYASPHKAIEELVSNAFDAGAQTVHVVLSPDRGAPDSLIAVIDDGVGMSPKDLKRHWLIGVSNKRQLRRPPLGRTQIGKFGIGKLATFVLATHLTHICKSGGRYFATTMDYTQIPEGTDKGIHTEKTVELPLRALSEAAAKAALAPVLQGNKEGYRKLRLFGPESSSSWTVAIMSGLKDLARQVQKGRLAWVLRTAMPLRDDFVLFLDGDRLAPSKSDIEPLHRWILGKDLLALPSPAPSDLEPTTDRSADRVHRYGLTHPDLGRLTGYLEVYESPLTEGKSSELGRSHGFFVYARGRLLNDDDELFGMDALRHGTFARFRMVAHIDRLDDELRSSREALREGPLLTTARNILHAAFNLARKWLEASDAERAPGVVAATRIASSPWSLTRRPILGLLAAALAGTARSRYLGVPPGLKSSDAASLLALLDERAKSDNGLVLRTELVELSQDLGIAVLDVRDGTLRINGLHPFVAAFRDDYERGRETLSLLAMAEVLTEAHLFELGVEAAVISEVLSRRDEMLREFARSVKRNAYMVAQALEDAGTDENRLEEELVAAFDMMGYAAVRIGGNGKPDGKADAHLGASDEGVGRRYSVSLEAKSKAAIGKSVSAKSVGVAIVAQHREEFRCDHSVVVGPEFPTTQGEQSSLVKQLRRDRRLSGKTITVVRSVDLARLVRLQAVKNLDLDRLRGLFRDCLTPEESKTWIDALLAEKPLRPPYEAILETIWTIQQETPEEAVEFAAVTTALRRDRELVLKKAELVELCKAMSRMTSFVVVRERTVELTQRPDRIIEAAGKVLQQYPEEEQAGSIFRSVPGAKGGS